LTAESFLARVKDLPVDEMCGIGRKMKKHLAALRVAGGNGIHTIGELHNCPREVLIKRFGPAYGEQLWLMGQGRDSSYGNGVPVDPNRNFEIAKSVGHSFTMPKFTTDLDLVKGYLLKLSEQVGRRMRKEKYKGRVVHLALGFGNFKFWAKQKKLEDYIDDGADIYREAEKLLQIAVDLRLGEPRYDRRGIDDGTVKGFRFVGVNVSDLLCQMDPISLLPEREQNKQVLKAVDAINDRFGEGTVQRLATLRAKMGEKVGMTSREKYILRPN
jgi:DNA polymerase-4